MEETLSAAPFVGVLGQIVMWFGFIVCLSLIKNYIIYGTALALSEWLIKLSDKSGQERVCRWLGDSDRILECLEEIKEKTGKSS